MKQLIAFWGLAVLWLGFIISLEVLFIKIHDGFYWGLAAIIVFALFLGSCVAIIKAAV